MSQPMAWVPWVTDPPARSAAATIVASVSSASVAPAALAFFTWTSMQYGHCVVMATATAISSFTFTVSAPSLNTAALSASNAAIGSGASSFIAFIFFKLAMSYIVGSYSVGVEVAQQPADVLGRVQQTPHLGQQVRTLGVTRR